MSEYEYEFKIWRAFSCDWSPLEDEIMKIDLIYMRSPRSTLERSQERQEKTARAAQLQQRYEPLTVSHKAPHLGPSSTLPTTREREAAQRRIKESRKMK